jgi:hypothetical protein
LATRCSFCTDIGPVCSEDSKQTLIRAYIDSMPPTPDQFIAVGFPSGRGLGLPLHRRPEVEKRVLQIMSNAPRKVHSTAEIAASLQDFEYALVAEALEDLARGPDARVEQMFSMYWRLQLDSAA